jgi:excisionase family DNA binding protein
MEEKFLNELQKLKNLTLLGVKQSLTMNDTALLTGLSKSHLYKLVMNKQIPYYKSSGGKITYFDKDEVTKWMLQNRVATSSEIEAKALNYCVTGKKI